MTSAPSNNPYLVGRSNAAWTPEQLARAQAAGIAGVPDPGVATFQPTQARFTPTVPLRPSGAVLPYRPSGPWRPVPPPPPRREGLMQALMIMGVVVVLGVLALVIYASTRDGGTGYTPTSDTGGDGRVAASSEVLYEVEGTASSVSITIEAPTGTQQGSGKAVPLAKGNGETGLTFQFEPGSFVYISAQNEGDSGSVTCRITVDGVVVSENTSSGGYTIATCDGSA